jgi:hypothetical protein
MGRKSIFHTHEAHILARLDFTVLYTSFLRIWKISKFASEPKAVLASVLPKTCVHDENMPKIYTLDLWGPYSCLVRHYGVVHNFFRFWKISSVGSKPKWLLAFGFTDKRLFMAKMGQKSIFHPRRPIFLLG